MISTAFDKKKIQTSESSAKIMKITGTLFSCLFSFIFVTFLAFYYSPIITLDIGPYSLEFIEPV